MTDWKEYSISVDQDAQDIITDIMIDLGANGVSIRDHEDLKNLPKKDKEMLWGLDKEKFPDNGIEIKAYFPLSDINPQFDQILREKIEKSVRKYQIARSIIKNEDWENNWKEYYHSFSVTRYLTIVPEWENYQPKNKEEKIIRLDPGLAFGTGTHPTTQLSIQGLEIIMESGESVVDVGTGSGVLAIASALLGANEIYAYDLDEMAVDSARANVALNNLPVEIQIQQNNLLDGIELKVDIVVANMLSHILMKLISDAMTILKKSGYFICSGIIIDKKEEVIQALKKEGFKIIQVNQIEDWIGIIAQKPF